MRIHTLRLTLFMLLALATACSSGNSNASDSGAADMLADMVADMHQPDTSVADTSKCELQLTLEGLTIVAATREVTVSAGIENLTGKVITLTVTDRCPAGFVDWSGVDGYDYYGTCTAGACSPDRPKTQTITLAAGEKKLVTTISMALNGDTCNKAIAHADSFKLTFSLPLVGSHPVVCGPNPATIKVEP